MTSAAVKPYTLAERNGRMCLLTPGGKKFQFDVFDLAWQAKLREHVVRQCREFAADPFVLGVAFADQPEWGQPRLEFFRGLPESAPGRKRLFEFQQAGRGDEDFLGLVSDTLYGQLKAAVREGAPHHLFFGERFVLRKPPEAVLRAIGKHVDVFCTQALILSRHRPPEWQTFQSDGWEREFKLTGKPVLVIDWAAPFSLGEAFDSEHGRIKTEAEAAADSAQWLADALKHPGIIGVFRCQLIGTHGNDRWFEGRAKRTYLRDDGTPFPIMAAQVSAANAHALQREYNKIEKSPVPASLAPAPSSQTSIQDPVAGIFKRMKHGIQVGNFDHDQDQEPKAEVNSDYLDLIKKSGFNSIRFFCTSDKKPDYYAPNVSYALKIGLVVNLCLFAWDYNTKSKDAFGIGNIHVNTLMMAKMSPMFGSGFCFPGRGIPYFWTES